MLTIALPHYTAGNSIRSEGASHLAELLEQNTSLTALNLRGNYIGLDGMRFLARGLSVNRTLRFLDLSCSVHFYCSWFSPPISVELCWWRQCTCSPRILLCRWECGTSDNIMGETGAGGPFVGDVTAEVLTDALVQSNSVEVLVLES